MPAAAPPLIDAEHAAFMQGGVSISLGSAGDDLLPNIGRAIGCKVSADRRRVTVFLSTAQSAALLADIRANGRIAAVFSEPSSHRTLQLKGRDAGLVELEPADRPRIAAYRVAFLREVAGLGFDATVAHSLLHCPDEDLAAVAFGIAAAYTQTPGPDAGAPLQAGA